MKPTKDICDLIAELEFQIGRECYNPKSYDGWNDIEGCSFRYPINVPSEDGRITKIRGRINDTYMILSETLPPDAVRSMKYKFGSNELYIGQGLMNALEYLEDRYGLDFERLENERHT